MTVIINQLEKIVLKRLSFIISLQSLSIKSKLILTIFLLIITNIAKKSISITMILKYFICSNFLI